MSSFREQKYLALLIVLATLVILSPALRAQGAARVAMDVLLTVIIVSSFMVASTSRPHRRLAAILGIATLLLLWVYYAVPEDVVVTRILFHLLAAGFFAFVVYVILHNIHRSKIINTDSIYGAFCGYLMLGILFGHLYSVAVIADAGAFRGEGYNYATAAEQRYLMNYFSFLTLTTVGYGDIVPASGEARGLAVVEAVLGQFYIAVLVAELIGKRQRQQPA